VQGRHSIDAAAILKAVRRALQIARKYGLIVAMIESLCSSAIFSESRCTTFRIMLQL
jgi:hypothetical protein